jgi:cytochrome b subunit of formate dehydrogenase
VFKNCPHPDEKQRLQLSRELGLAPRQIKFWFQNRRTQMKVLVSATLVSNFLLLFYLFIIFLILTCSYAIQAQHEMRGGMEKVEKKHEKRESHARWLEKRKAKGNKKL